MMLLENGTIAGRAGYRIDPKAMNLQDELLLLILPDK